MKIITREQIERVLPSLDLVPIIEAGFVAYSESRAVVPPVGELILDKGEVHIKHGYIKGDEYYVIKIASGFYDNTAVGLPSGNGCMLLFRQETGEPVGLLLDEGILTDTRTAIAGAIAAKHLAPDRVDRIGIVGTGIQATLQLRYLAAVTDCRHALVWGRSERQVDRYCEQMSAEGYDVEGAPDTSYIMRECDLIVTTTPSKKPLLNAADLKSGTHITAVGSDTPYKQELDVAILERADVVVADSISQCVVRGEIFKAIGEGKITKGDVVELGSVIAGGPVGRVSDSQVTVADLTGVAVQDIGIATAVYEAVS